MADLNDILHSAGECPVCSSSGALFLLVSEAERDQAENALRPVPLAGGPWPS